MRQNSSNSDPDLSRDSDSSCDPASVQNHYRGEGWRFQDDHTLDAHLNEDLREASAAYVSACRERVQRQLPQTGGSMLDMASGPVQYPEYVAYSKGFERRVCVDFSKHALQEAVRRLGDHCEPRCGDFLEMELEEDAYDAVISLHTLYHMPFDRQKEVVERLVASAKQGAPIVVVTKNPKEWSRRWVVLFKKWFLRSKATDQVNLYNAVQPLEWWDQFSTLGKLEIKPWRSFSARHMKVLFPNNRFGSGMLSLLFRLEESFPNFFVQHFKFWMVVITKK